jgi:hypothetical protein
MEQFLSFYNKTFITNASVQMLKDKFDIVLTAPELNKILINIFSNIYSQYNNKNLTTIELNKITLVNLKEYMETSINKQNTNDNVIEKINNTVMDNEFINKKLKELENNRKILPAIVSELHKDDNAANILTNNNPISINIPVSQTKDIEYKNFIINSNNRDWFLNPDRNNININIPINVKNNLIYPESICFPKNIKNMTPYVLMNISDGIKDITYTFLCKTQNDNWDIWTPCSKNIEPISLNNHTWMISFYDFTDKLLDIGSDDLEIIKSSQLKSSQLDDMICLNIKYLDINNNLRKDDYIMIRSFNGIIYKKKIHDCIYSDIIIDKKDLNDINDLNKGRILNISKQYSCIFKYNST